MKKLTFGKQGRSSAIAWILPALICLACLASCATPEHSLGTTPKAGTLAQQGYFIETPWPFRIQGVRFSPSLISGNGEVLLGSIRDGMVTWSAKAGFQPVAAFPPGYDLVVRNLSRDGSVATGVFIQNPPGSFRVTDFGIFRWPLDHRAELLSPHFLQSDSGEGMHLDGQIKISGDGNKVWLFCNNDIGTKYCPITSAKPEHWVAEVWSRQTGFTLANTGLPSRFTYVTPLGDGTVSLAGVLGTSDFGLIRAGGKFTPLAGFPADFDPQNDSLITNSAVTVIYLRHVSPSNDWFGNTRHEWLWNAQGKSLPMPIAPSPCPNLPIQINAIDDQGVIFADAICSGPTGYSPTIGLRISSAGTQTLGDWLRSRGVANDLPASAEAGPISADGRTIFGQTAPMIAVGARATASSAHTGCQDTACLFLAHVP